MPGVSEHIDVRVEPDTREAFYKLYYDWAKGVREDDDPDTSMNAYARFLVDSGRDRLARLGKTGIKGRMAAFHPDYKG